MLKLKAHSGFHDLFLKYFMRHAGTKTYLRLRTMSHTIYAAKFEQMIIHQHAHLRRESQSNAPAHVLMKFTMVSASS
jgi:calcineurin-like phosphoesterase family protein